MTSWRRIWNDRRGPDGTRPTLADLIAMDGFDAGAGKIQEHDWSQYVESVSSKIGIRADDSVYEVGCGSGAFLYPLYTGGHRVGGLDYSEALVQHARKAMAGMDFAVCDATQVDTDVPYDYVVANGVFHYFPGLDYAETVLRGMIRKCVRAVAVLDVPDLQSMEESEGARRGALPSGDYDRRYDGLTHLYYDKAWFGQVGEATCRVSVFDQNIRDYGNSAFRFNCLLEKLR